jgi:hypothetical protein
MGGILPAGRAEDKAAEEAAKKGVPFTPRRAARAKSGRR